MVATVDSELAQAIGGAYDLGPIRACARFDRVASSVARVEVAERAYWLKLLTRTRRSLEALESEAEVAGELADCGLAVARAVRRRDGRYAGTLPLAEGAVSALLFDEAPGVEVETPSVAQGEALGALLARFHAVAASAADRRARIDVEALGRGPLRAIGAWLERAGGDGAREVASRLAGLETVVDEMVARVAPAGASLPIGLCHGDVRLENVRFDGDRPAVFDLECCGMGPRAYDLACYWRSRVGLAADGEARRAEWEALLRGYERIARLTALERQAIPALAALRAVWVLALPAAPGTAWGQDWLLDVEYVDGHVAMIERLARVARGERAAG